MSLAVVILAAGQGVRMRSTLPKVLHPVAGVPMLGRVLATVNQLDPDQVVVVCGDHEKQLKESLLQQATLKSSLLIWAKQEKPLGTGHAVLSALPFLEPVERVLILFGDMPLITASTLRRLLVVNKDSLGIMTQEVAEPFGLGRIVRDSTGKVLSIVEEKDATLSEKAIKEINTGCLIAPRHYLEEWVKKLTPANAQQEYYLTDIVALAHQAGVTIATITPEFEWEALGVNDKIQLAAVERIFQLTEAKRLMQEGVTVLDPNRLDLRGEITVGKNVTLDVNVILEGKVMLGNNVKIGSNVYIKNSQLADDVQILANSVIEGAAIGQGCCIGPFARVRPETVLASQAKIGNFVEIKKAVIGANTKINHLSYVGDATLGKDVNVGAGTITCNFDGTKKHETIIKDRVFIGSDTQLIAPVTIGEDVTIGAGTTVTRDVAPGYLVHNRGEQRTIANWKKIKKDKLKEDQE